MSAQAPLPPRGVAEVLVIIPTRNAAEATRRSIESCLAQTVFCPVFVIDNASDDDSLEDLLRSYESEATVSFFQNNKNLGRTGNWNRGLELAEDRGAQYVRFLFSGDELLPNCQEECAQVLADNPDVAALAHDYFFSTGTTQSVSRRPLRGRLDANTVDRLNHFDGGFMGSIVSNVYSMHAVGNHRFNETLVGKTSFDFHILEEREAYYLPKALSRTNVPMRRTFASAASYAMVCEDTYARISALERAKDRLPVGFQRKAERRIFSDHLRRSTFYLPPSSLLLGAAQLCLRVALGPLVRFLRFLKRAIA